MITTHLPRLRWPLLAACALALTSVSSAGAGHDAVTAYSPTNVLHLNVVNNQFAGGTTARDCSVGGTVASKPACLRGYNSGPDNAVGVDGTHGAVSGTGAGVFGETLSTSPLASGVHGVVSSTVPGGGSAGVRGINNGTGDNGIGVSATQNGSGFGVRASTPNGTGVLGFHTASGASGADPGVLGVTNSTSVDAAGVAGHVHSNAANAAGVRGLNTNASCCGMGVAGFHLGQGIGIYGESLQGFAISGFSPDNWSGYFQGNVRVVGNLQKNSGSFTIDHPLDPANKFLSHSFVESPDMLNVYNGNVRTNAKGFATVKLPHYFAALNRDFRYQLTGIGRAAWGARIVVWKEIENNRFIIRSEPNVKVSWLVTGVRKDRWANAHRIKVEEAKNGSEAGKYLNPELYGKPAAKSVVVLPGMDKVSPRTRSPVAVP